MAGLLLVAVAWPLAWFGPAPLSEYTFFPLWLGYVLAVDGLTFQRSSASLLIRNRRRFALLFVFSLPIWWLFEIANRSLSDWRYVPARQYGTFAYIALASLAFSTVLPAVFVTAEFYRSFPFFAGPRRWIKIAPSRTGLIVIAAAGLVMFVGALAFPRTLFPLVWIGLFLLLDAVNALTGAKSLAEQMAQRRWDTVLVLFAAGITCGFFWEMWNFWSLPKWVYDVPYASRPKVFELPLLGYGGYLPFALEVYACSNLLHALLFRRCDDFLRFDAPYER